VAWVSNPRLVAVCTRVRECVVRSKARDLDANSKDKVVVKIKQAVRKADVSMARNNFLNPAGLDGFPERPVFFKHYKRIE